MISSVGQASPKGGLRVWRVSIEFIGNARMHHVVPRQSVGVGRLVGARIVSCLK